MNRSILILTALVVGGFSAGAQSIADNESVLRDRLWFSGNNAAALSIRPADIKGDLTLNYLSEAGELHLQQDPASVNDVSLHTSGTSRIGALTVWGEFTFQNRFEEGAKFNALRYEPEEDHPYFVSDTCASGWNKQAYKMAAKIASPLLWNHFTFGVKVDYNTKVGAKQKDPRGLTYKRGVSLYPSATATFGKNTFGLYGFYANDFERSSASNANFHKDQTVLLTTGLGEGSIGSVGGNNGLGTYYFNRQEFGGGLQYNFTADKADIFAEAVFKNTAEEVIQSPSRPHPMGHIKRNTIEVEAVALLGESKAHKISADAQIRLTTGVEPTLQKPTATVNEWIVITENNMMDMTKVNAHAAYDFRSLDRGRYSWSAGADAWFSMRDYTHFAPMDTFNASYALVMANYARQFRAGKNSSVLVRGEAGYNLALGGEYVFTGGTKTLRFQQQYINDIAFLTSSYAKAGARVGYSHKAGKVSYNIDLKAHYLMGVGSEGSRAIASISAGILF